MRPFTVTLSAASGKLVAVDYATSNGTATAGGGLHGGKWHPYLRSG